MTPRDHLLAGLREWETRPGTPLALQALLARARSTISATPYPGSNSPTSRLAGVQAAYRAPSLCARLLKAYAMHRDGLTDIEAGVVGDTREPWKRCSDLRRFGHIVDTGRTSLARLSRCESMVCSITEAGLDYLAKLEAR